MKRKTMRNAAGFALIELMVVIVVIAALASMLLPALSRAKGRSPRISCVNYLKQIGIAYRVWDNDNGDLYPAQQTVSKGGWADLLTNANQGAMCWTNYAIMQNELGQSPKMLICPADERQPATNFNTDFKNANISYFVCVSSCDIDPQSILGGDRNLGSGPEPDADYGFSPQSGKGNDVAIPTNSLVVSWSLKMHSGAGNILLGDGSTQQVTSAGFRQNWLRNANPTTNWPAGHVPPSPSI